MNAATIRRRPRLILDVLGSVLAPMLRRRFDEADDTVGEPPEGDLLDESIEATIFG